MHGKLTPLRQLWQPQSICSFCVREVAENLTVRFAFLQRVFSHLPERSPSQ